jgi:hypothetical protein
MNTSEKLYIILGIVIVILIMIVMALSYEIRLCQKSCSSGFSVVRDAFKSTFGSRIGHPQYSPPGTQASYPGGTDGFAACPTCH